MSKNQSQILYLGFSRHLFTINRIINSFLFSQFFTGGKGFGNRFDEQRLTLRIHRGRSQQHQHHESPHSNGSAPSTTTSIGSPSPERLSRFSTRKHEKIKISVSYPSNENLSIPSHHQQTTQLGAHGNALYAVHYTSNNGKEHTSSHLYRNNISSNSTHKESYLSVSSGLGGSGGSNGDKMSSPRSSKKMGKRNIKAQVKRFRMETKAAKTLAIIVGCFILCWCPFFTLYLIRPFCNDCIDPLLFSILFWLGYCNSALNPLIYGLFSKDFRFAFKRIICKCFCSGPAFGRDTSRRGSDMSHFKTGGRTPSISPSAHAHSLDENSDPVQENSDSR